MRQVVRAGASPATPAVPALGTGRTAEQWEPDEWRRSRLVLGGGGGAIPLLYSTYWSPNALATTTCIGIKP
jgi:hypothetical protein